MNGKEQETNRITFDEMPSLINDILATLQNVVEDIVLIKNKINPRNHWLDVNKLIEYLPTQVTKRTVYDWIRYRKIPYHKKDGKVAFLESEIDEWLKSDSCVSDEMPKLRAEEYIKNNPIKR